MLKPHKAGDTAPIGPGFLVHRQYAYYMVIWLYRGGVVWIFFFIFHPTKYEYMPGTQPWIPMCFSYDGEDFLQTKWLLGESTITFQVVSELSWGFNRTPRSVTFGGAWIRIGSLVVLWVETIIYGDVKKEEPGRIFKAILKSGASPFLPLKSILQDVI